MSKRKNAGRIVCVLFALLFVVFATGTAFSSGVNVNINVGPPAVVIAEPPEVIVVPQTMVYFAPGVGVDLFFHAGYWWTPKEERWFRARSYNGPWIIVAPRAVPVEIVRVPRDYRKVYAHEHRIPYGQLKKHHRLREQDRKARRGEWKEWKEDRKGHREGNNKGHGKDHRKGNGR